ncbi:lysozyme [cf. Phormidesmis sp. LEGE 11477]|uniref:lysozyme n=1 Tax=cf. Phormidesmis sp. LEGE 11477 TaxID=1828680 RepID=UPI00187E6AED|nr:lysozyme [cf. Phormidesmis sp. LEGE 11477]MBE9059562.1 lysozyme [cf. Phormidesmis sp. LEGE 11477]
MGTWIKETDVAFYLMDGGHYISKITKYPSKHNPAEQVLNVAGMKAWFSRPDAPRGMTVSRGGTGPEPKPKPELVAAAPIEQDTAGAKSGSGPKRTNKNGLLLIKSFEGLRLKAYKDAVGIWTIGYGTTRGVRPGQVISEAQAVEFLRADLARFEKSINEVIQAAINDNQFSALACFTYNVGPGAFRSSTLLRRLNGSDVRGAADELLRWDKAGGRTLAGLTRRRKAERALFLGEDFHQFL